MKMMFGLRPKDRFDGGIKPAHPGRAKDSAVQPEDLKKNRVFSCERLHNSSRLDALQETVEPHHCQAIIPKSSNSTMQGRTFPAIAVPEKKLCISTYAATALELQEISTC
jgi:hypothetical protein